MPHLDFFGQARKSISRYTIESLFPGGTWKNNEYFIRNPLRDDEHVGSFSISDTGLFNDFSTKHGGDLIDLVSKSKNVSKIEAAHIIVKASGGIVNAFHSERTEKVSSTHETSKAMIPIPEDEIALFNPQRATGKWIYRNKDGKAWCVVVRYDKPNGRKYLIPYYYDGNGWKKGNPIKKNRQLFNINKLIGSNLPVVIVEGEKCATIIVNGFIVLTWIGGCKAVEKSDFSMLKDRHMIIIWPDFDKPGIDAAYKIKSIISHAEILKIEGRSEGWDIADAVAEGIDPVQFIKECPRVNATAAQDNIEKKDDGEKRGRPRKSNMAMDLLKKYPLCKFKDKRFMIRGNQAIPIGSRTYKDFVTGEFFRATREPLTSVQIDEVISIHRAHAGESEEQQVYTRIASPSGDTSFIDLNDGKDTILEVDADGWRVAENPSVFFLRSINMESLPMPVQGGSIEHLKEVFNLEREEDFSVVVAALCYILRGRPKNRGAYPIIVATGIEGSAKTTFMKIVKKLIDPGTPETRTPSNDTKDLFIAAGNALILSLDNISYINREMSDALCSLATGGGFARKKNYTDDEEQIFDLCRPILLNGISFDRAPDLLSRSIIIELRPIPQDERKTESEIWSIVEKFRPSIFDGLLSILSNAIREEKKMQNERFNLPRLADFGRFSIALERGNNWEVGRIISSFNTSYNAALDDKAEANPVISIIIDIVIVNETWSGSSTELLKEINSRGNDTDKRLSIWPKTPAALGILLKRDYNVYANQGVKISYSRNKHGRQWTLSTMKKKCDTVINTTPDISFRADL